MPDAIQVLRAQPAEKCLFLWPGGQGLVLHMLDGSGPFRKELVKEQLG